MFTVYFTGPRTQISVTVPKFETALFLIARIRAAGRKVRVWSHVRKEFV